MLDRSKLTIIFSTWANIMDRNRDYLTELDSIVGDGDLGLTMGDGFAAAANSVRLNSDHDLGKTIFNAGKVMADAVPSTMGTLMSSGLLNAGKYAKGKLTLSLSEFADCMDAFMQGVMKLGKAQVGEKTFLDAFYPAVTTLKTKAITQQSWSAALHAAAVAAREGFENTASMIAVHGRAATRGEASRSLLDPGSAVAMLLMEAVAEISEQLDD